MNELLNEQSLLVGVDIGGSHITAALVDLDKRCKVSDSEIRRYVNSAGTSNEILDQWINVISDVVNQYDNTVKRIGIAMPGPFDYENGVSWIKNMNKYEALYGLNIKESLAQGLGIEPACILFRNDAEAFLEGEVYCGAARNFNKVIGITLGTGLGSAYSINGLTKDYNLGVSLFKDGIAEDYLSTRWFIRRYLELKGNYIQDVKSIVIAAEKGDEAAIKVFEEFCIHLSDFLCGFIDDKHPEIVVIGGNIARAEELYLKPVQSNIAKQYPDVQLVTSELWEEAALVGAAFCWVNEKKTELF